MEHEIIPLGDPVRWEKALLGLAFPYTHTWEYCSVIAHSSGFETMLWTARCAEGRFACPLSVRATDSKYPELVSPYGFGGIVSAPAEVSVAGVREEWRTFWKRRGFVTAFVQQHPGFRLSHEVWGEDMYEHHAVYEIDLKAPVGDLWQCLCSTHRYEIRHLKGRNGVRIVVGAGLLKEALLRLYPETVNRVGASAVYHFAAEALERLAEGPGALLLGIQEGESVEAVALFLYTPEVAEYFLNASTPGGRKYSRLLIWSAIESLKERGIGKLNLGGGVKEGDSLDAFKRRFGGKMVKTQVLKQVLDQEKYDRLLAMRGLTDDSRAGYFPPYWDPKVAAAGRRMDVNL